MNQDDEAVAEKYVRELARVDIPSMREMANTEQRAMHVADMLCSLQYTVTLEEDEGGAAWALDAIQALLDENKRLWKIAQAVAKMDPIQDNPLNDCLFCPTTGDNHTKDCPWVEAGRPVPSIKKGPTP